LGSSLAHPIKIVKMKKEFNNVTKFLIQKRSFLFVSRIIK
jgi:hypothetical protein